MITTRIFKVDPAADFSSAVAQAAQVIRDGGTVAFPTETVYGVASRADRKEAVARLREVKGRGETKPFTVHIGRRSDADRFVAEMTPIARRLIKKGWPGPITLVFKNIDPSLAPIADEFGREIIDLVYHENSVGLRFPDDPVACALLIQAGVPIIAASANLAGQPPAVSGAEALRELNGRIDLLLDAGRTRYGRASTIVEVLPSGYSILRTGVIDERTVRRLATVSILLVCTGNTCRSPMAEALSRQILAERLSCSISDLSDRGIEIRSAGTSAMSDAPASPEAVEVMKKRGLDLSSHRSQRVSRELIHRADYIWTLTQAHREAVIDLSPESAERVETLVKGDDVEDPIGLGIADYEACARQIGEALKTRLAEVQL